MSHKYLNKLGIKSDSTAIFNTEEKDQDRDKRFKKQRKKYGFDERETWCLDYTFITWLYSHLRLYKKVSIVNLDYHKFEIPVLYELSPDELEYDTGCKYPKKYYKEVIETHTQGEAINLMIYYFQFYLLNDNSEIEPEFRAFEKAKCGIKIFAEVFGAMWW